jgi:hypothetical protein
MGRILSDAEALMKKLYALAAAVALTSGCSTLLYPGRHQYPYAARVRPRADAIDASPVGRWDSVMRLPRSATIDVLTRDGAAAVGPITGADLRSVRIELGGAELRIDRSEVVRIDLVDVAGSSVGAVAKGVAGGALLGAGAMALFAGVIGGEVWPPPGALLRAGAATGGWSGGQAAVVRRQPRLIYLAPNP